MRTLQLKIKYKIRFLLARLLYCPVTYRLGVGDGKYACFHWSKIMPFFDPSKGLFNYDLWGWNVRELLFLNNYLLPGMAFFDIGAHHGIYSVFASGKVAPGGSVYSFEPNFWNYCRLKHHFWLNRVDNARIERMAVSNQDGLYEFFTSFSGNDLIGSLRSTTNCWKCKKNTVKSIRLDTYVRTWSITRIDFIKVDVEGGELSFLDGARDSIKLFDPVLLIEVLDDPCKPWGYMASDISNKLKNEYGYELFEFTPKGRLFNHSIKSEYPHTSNANLLAVPPAKLDSVRNFMELHAEEHG